MIRKSWQFKRVFGLISDTHVGSYFGLWPPDFKDDLGTPKPQSFGQEMLWEEWLMTAKFFDEFGVDTILHAGDAMDGQNHKEAGINLMTTNMQDQIRAAYMTLRIVCPEESGRGFHMVGGSGYHQGQGKGQLPEQTLTEKLGGTYHGPVMMANPKKTDRVLLMLHGVSGAFVYKTTVMSRELLFQAEAEALKKIDNHIDIRIMGHWHTWVHLDQSYQRMIQLPAWKVWDASIIAQKSYGKMQPDLGAAILIIDKQDRILVIKRLLERVPKIADYMKEI